MGYSRFCNESEASSFRTPAEKIVPSMSAADLQDQTPRTLLFGLTAERESFHVYIGPDLYLHRVIYHPDWTNSATFDPATFDPATRPIVVVDHRDGSVGNPIPVEDLIPRKRIYAESLDLEFAMTLRFVHQMDLPVLPWNQERADRVAGLQFHGVVL